MPHSIERIATLSREELQALARRLQPSRRAEGPRITKRTGGAAGDPIEAPLSYAQEGLWLLEQIELPVHAYNESFALRLTGALHVDALRRAFEHLVRRHEILRTRFVATADGRGAQVVDDPGAVPFEIVDLTDVPRPDIEARAAAFASRESARRFDLASGRTWRATLGALADREHVLVVAMHHIICDGRSFELMLGELGTCYAAYAQQMEPVLADVEVQYADYALWQREWLGGERLEQPLAYWRTQLAAAPASLDLPTDRPRPRAFSHRGAARHFVLDARLSATLAELSRDEGVTLYMTLLAAFQVLLSRWSGQTDIVVGTPVSGRAQRETERLLGCFVNTLPMRGDLSGDPSFRALLGRVRDVALAAYAHQEVPFERLVADLVRARGLSHQALFQVMFVLHARALPALEWPGVTLTPLEVERDTAKFDLSLELFETAAGLVGRVEYATDLFDAATIDALTSSFATLLESLTADPDQPIRAIALLTPADRQRMLVDWNATHTADRGAGCVHERFAVQATRTPEAPAVIVDGVPLTYGALDARSNQLARHLRHLGVGPEVVVGLCVERSADLIVGLLAILKAGGAYLPLDPDHPRERLAFVLADARPLVVLTHEAVAERLPAERPPDVWLDRDWPLIARQPSSALPSTVRQDNLAYVMYTSGSTGTPKAVAAAHAGIVNRVLTQASLAPFDADDVCCHKTSVGFVDSVFEILGPLMNGRPIVVAATPSGDTEALVATLAREGVTRLVTVPSLAQALVQVPDGARRLARVRHWTMSGEPLPSDLLSQLRAALPACRFLNLYGTSEVAADATAYPCEPADDAAPVPIGRPLANCSAYVLDERLEPVPVGVIGDLYVGGAGLARGYRDRPDLTAERFVAHPWGPPGSRLYRTGDRARYRADGALVFAGRADQQVKVRGVRIELGEVEAALRSSGRVLECAAITHGEGLDAQLVAYVVSDGALDADAVRAHLRTRLPDTMVPAAIVSVSALPLTATGKIDRRALAARDVSGALERRYVAPATETEEALAQIWAQVLDVEDVGAKDDFFQRGGHSLRAAQMVVRVRERFGVELPLRAIFDAPTLRALAEAVDRAVARAGGGPPAPLLPPLVAKPRPHVVPLSLTQERLWLLEQLASVNGAYDDTFAVRLRGPLRVDALEAAIGELIQRHEMLRTRIERGADGRGMQRIEPPSPFQLHVEAFPPLTETELERTIRERVQAEARQPFVLTEALFRVRLLRCAAEDHVLLISTHHLVSDGWSFRLLMRELDTLYAACVDGRPSPLPALDVQYADYALWQREWLDDERLARQLAYWRERLAGLPPALDLPTDRPRPPVFSYRGAQRMFTLSRELTQALAALGRREGATLYMVLLAAYQLLLARWSGQNDVVVGSPVAGRRVRETERMIGFFVNTLVMRTDVSGRPSFRELLARVRDVALDAFAHQDVPFEQLVAELDPVRDASRHSLYQAAFILQNQPVPWSNRWADVALEPLDVAHGSAKFDLLLTLVDLPDGLWGRVEYAADLFDASTIERLMDSFRSLLDAIVADPEQSVSELPLLTRDERSRLLTAWNDTAAPFAEERCLHDLIEEAAERAPDAPAVLVAGDTDVMNYGQLNARSNQLAHYLRSIGVGPDVLVGLSTERTPAMIVGLLAIWKAGGAYVPLDPTFPDARLRYVVQDARLTVVLAPHADARLTVGGALRCIALDTLDLGEYPRTNPRVAMSPDNLSYVIYTSGSTGQPKGVMVRHRGVVNYASHIAGRYVRESDRGALITITLAFDATITSLLPPLISGRSITLLPEGDRELPALAAAFAAGDEYSLVKLTPSHLTLLQAAYPEAVRDGAARALFIGGEALSAAHIAPWRQYAPAVRVINHYGPTETVVGCATYEVTAATPHSGPIPIGRPVSNTQLYVLDADLGPVPIGVIGELYIAGAGVARGYLGRPALTAERFVANPFGAPGTRLYRTGDRVRRLADGNLEYVGRIDHQVKLHGFRIEPGEIEAVLRQDPRVQACVVIAHGADAHTRLVAYVVAAADLDTEDLRARMRAQLPDYMVPSAFVRLAALPVTPNGKLDRRALPAPDDEAYGLGEYQPPVGEIETSMARVWAEVLGLERVGRDDNFFEIGGQSLLAVTLIERLREHGLAVDVHALFMTPTIAELAATIGSDMAIEIPPNLIPVRP